MISDNHKKYLRIVILLDLLLFITGIIYINIFPDFDTDAYAHHAISREIYLGNSNLNIHWVWLPLFHYIQVVFIALGFTMQILRYMNLAITAVIPIVLYFHLKKSEDKDLPYQESFIAAIICMLFPVLILMGTTAQPEPMFCLLILLFGIFFSRKKYFISSLFLTVAVLLRYEAWVLPPAIIFFTLWTMFFRKPAFLKNEIQSAKPLNSVILPLIAMAIWTVARYFSEGVWFGFIFVTKGFANEVLKSSSSFDSGILQFIYDIFYYPLIVPYYLAGPFIILAFFGIKRTLQRQKYMWAFLYSVILLFLIITWINKSTLGLHRHFAVLVPFYSVLLVNGIPYASDLISGIRTKLRPGKKSDEETKNKIKKVLGVLMIISQIVVTLIWSAGWLSYTSHLFIERYQTIDFIKKLPPKKIIFCDEASIEVLSELDLHIFNRIWLENNEALDMIQAAKKSDKDVYIVTWDRKMKRYFSEGEIVFTSSPDYNTKETLQVLKVKK